MKRTATTYHCDVCDERIQRDETKEVHHSGNFGLCQACRDKGFVIRCHPLPDEFSQVVYVMSPDEVEDEAALARRLQP